MPCSRGIGPKPTIRRRDPGAASACTAIRHSRMPHRSSSGPGGARPISRCWCSRARPDRTTGAITCGRWRARFASRGGLRSCIPARASLSRTTGTTSRSRYSSMAGAVETGSASDRGGCRHRESRPCAGALGRGAWPCSTGGRTGESAATAAGGHWRVVVTGCHGFGRRPMPGEGCVLRKVQDRDHGPARAGSTDGYPMGVAISNGSAMPDGGYGPESRCEAIPARTGETPRLSAAVRGASRACTRAHARGFSLDPAPETAR